MDESGSSWMNLDEASLRIVLILQARGGAEVVSSGMDSKVGEGS